MIQRHLRHADGKFHINGKTFDTLVGSRAQVWHNTVYRTSGYLTKKNLLKNKHGNIVSRLKHVEAKKNNRLAKAGYKPIKGMFVLMNKSMKHMNKNLKRSKKSLERSKKSLKRSKRSLKRSRK